MSSPTAIIKQILIIHQIFNMTLLFEDGHYMFKDCVSTMHALLGDCYLALIFHGFSAMIQEYSNNNE